MTLTLNSTSLLLAVIMLSSLTACSDDSDEAVQFKYYEIATVLSSNSVDGTRLLLYRPVTGEPVTLTARQYIDGNTLVQSPRMIFGMECDNRSPYDGGSVTLLTCQAVKPMTVTPGDPADIETRWEESPALDIEAAWFTGPWLNLRAVTPDNSGRTISLVTVADPVEQTKLDIYAILSDGDDNIYARQYYWSASLAETIEQTGCQTVTLHINNPANPTTATLKLDIPSSLIRP